MEPMSREAERLIEVLAYNLYHAALGNNSPWTNRIGEDLRSPRIGDLVVEWTTMYRPHADGQRFGRWTKRATEPVMTEAEWEREKREHPYMHESDEPVPTDTFDYVETPNNGQVRWFNHNFIKVPEEIYTYEGLFPEHQTHTSG